MLMSKIILDLRNRFVQVAEQPAGYYNFFLSAVFRQMIQQTLDTNAASKNLLY
jgi:hypothetical protein